MHIAAQSSCTDSVNDIVQNQNCAVAWGVILDVQRVRLTRIGEGEAIDLDVAGVDGDQTADRGFVRCRRRATADDNAVLGALQASQMRGMLTSSTYVPASTLTVLPVTMLMPSWMRPVAPVCAPAVVTQRSEKSPWKP